MFLSKTIAAVLTLLLFITDVAAQSPCTDSLPGSLLFNNSFEQYSGCSTTPSIVEGGLIDYAPYNGGVTVAGWHPFILNFAIRYFNYDCKNSNPYSVFDTSFFSDTAPYYPSVPLPLPDGNGFIAITQHNNTSIESNTSKTYITACLSAPLKADTPYAFSFDFAFGRLSSGYFPATIGSPSPYRVAIFGRKDCPGYPIYNDNPDSANGCLANRSGWIQLGVAELQGINKWVQGVIEFTPPFNINCIGIGPDCSLNSNIGDTTAMYYMDNFVLVSKASYSYKFINALSGNPCTGNFFLQAPSYTNASYKWYRDGSIITNATSHTYKVPDTPGAAGSYTVNIVLPNNTCLNSLPYTITFSNLEKFDLGKDTILCAPANIILNAQWPNVSQYEWQDGSQKPFLIVNSSGNYWAHLTDQYGCTKRDSLNVVMQKCDSCSFLIPTAFTPNSDGLNDLFRVKPNCTNLGLKSYTMRIFNRYGQPVFESNDINKGWDGRYKNYPQNMGAYVYFISYVYQNKKMTEKGTVVLIR